MVNISTSLYFSKKNKYAWVFGILHLNNEGILKERPYIVIPVYKKKVKYGIYNLYLKRICVLVRLFPVSI